MDGFYNNMVILKGYSEFIEHELETSMENVTDEESLEEMIEDFTFHRDEFILLFFADGILCIAVLVMISLFFTKKLTRHQRALVVS